MRPSGSEVTAKSEALVSCKIDGCGRVAFRLARFINVGIDDLLAGRFPEPGVCPRCAYRLPLDGRYGTPSRRAARSAVGGTPSATGSGS